MEVFRQKSMLLRKQVKMKTVIIENGEINLSGKLLETWKAENKLTFYV